MAIEPTTDQVGANRDTGAMLLTEFLTPDRLALLDNCRSSLVGQAEPGTYSARAYQEAPTATYVPILCRNSLRNPSNRENTDAAIR